MIFDAVDQPIAAIAQAAKEHLTLWVHRAPRHLDTLPEVLVL